MNAPITAREAKPDLTRAVVNRMVQVLGIVVIQAIVLFAAAGELDWPAAWAFFGVYVAVLAVNALVLLPNRKELVAERGRIREDAKPWDKWLATLASLVFPLITLIVAGLDVRFLLSPEIGLAVHLAALAVMAAGLLLITWSMASNPFFSGTVRIQSDRGHRVASGGPYRYVRHPGYVGMILHYGSIPLVLGSLWALIPALIGVALFVVRTALEDRTLQAELPGYREYAQQTRYRLLPGIW